MNLLKKVIHFYIDGFRNMDRLGRKLWIIILVKLFIFFIILRLIFFPNFLNEQFDSKEQKGDYVLDQITKTK